MGIHLTTFEGSITDAIAEAIKKRIDDAEVDVAGSGGHFRIAVKSAQFEGKSTLQRHRLVLGAIAHLMDGDSAPVHAVDSLETTTP